MASLGLLGLLVFLLCPPWPAYARIFIVDDTGHRVTLKAPPRRIVSLYPAHSENLLALGLRGRLVAVAEGDDPSLFKGIRQMPLRPDPESILALKPDLVLMRSLQLSMQPNLLKRLEGIVPVAVLDPPSFGGLESYILRLGRITGQEGTAREKLNWALNLLQRSRARSRRGQRTAFLVVNSRDITTCSPGSWPYRLMEASGLTPAADEADPTSPGSAVARFGAERLLMISPKVEAVLVQIGPMNHQGAKAFLEDHRFSPMEAVKRGNVFQVDERTISRPSLLRLPMALKELEDIRERIK